MLLFFQEHFYMKKSKNFVIWFIDLSLHNIFVQMPYLPHYKVTVCHIQFIKQWMNIASIPDLEL